MQTKREVVRFCKWIRMILSAAPIEHLRVICDHDDEDAFYGANICFDNIIDHLAGKHSATLRILDLRSAYLGVMALELLFTTCTGLEELYISAGKRATVSSSVL